MLFTDIWEPYSAVRVLKDVFWVVTQTQELLNINKHSDDFSQSKLKKPSLPVVINHLRHSLETMSNKEKIFKNHGQVRQGLPSQHS